MLPKIALLGRPNVGKSTIFNRIIRSNRAITYDLPGITRDRIEGTVYSQSHAPFILVDTGGVTIDNKQIPVNFLHQSSGFEKAIFQQAQIALNEAQAICFVVDGRDGLMPFDEHLAIFIRKSGKPTLVAVNKVDRIEKEGQAIAEFHILGFPIIAASAEHGHNLRLIRHNLAALLPKITPKQRVEPKLRLAILGRPNAGKSSLINTITGKQRMIISDIAGTTRDSVDIPFIIKNEEYVFIDTAGIRRRTKIIDTIEQYSVNASLKSASKADITLYLIDATEGILTQDKRLINLLDTKKIPFFLLINKIDLLTKKQRSLVLKESQELIEFCSHIPLLTISALTSEGIEKIIPTAKQIYVETATRITTHNLNKAVKEIFTRHQPPVIQRVRPKLFYTTQAETHPPTFIFFVNDAQRVTESYKRYLEKALRKKFHLQYTPIRIHLRSSHKKKIK